MVATVLSLLITLYIWVLLGRVIVSWVPMLSPGWRPKGIVLVLVEAIYSLTDPPVRFLQRWIKPVRIGNASLDLSVLVLFILLQVLQRMVWTFIGF